MLMTACSGKPVVRTGECEDDNAGLTLPAGFCARIYADDVGAARHLAVAPNGDVYVAIEDANTASAGTTRMRGRGGLFAFRDTSGDGRADLVRPLNHLGGHGIAMRGDTLWFSTSSTVYRYVTDARRFGAVGPAETIVEGMPTGGHSSRSLALGDSNALFVNVGSDSNVCDGEDPCAETAVRAAIWKLDASRPRQRLEDGIRYASGIRNAVGLVWNPDFHSLFATQHGRDELGRFRQYYAAGDNDVLPSEEFMRVARGDDFGWPYCYHDWRINKKVLAPEYGGDGARQERCANAARPLMGFPGHWAPDGLAFYNGTMFPPKYRHGAFIAFHGSWNRRRHDGYKVVFVPFAGAMPAGDYEIFADGFAGERKGPGSAQHRPVGVTVAPDGSLYITDDQRGRIYNIRFNGKDDSTGRR